MRPRTTIALTTALVAAVSMIGLTGTSSATWIDSSTATSTVSAAADWTPPTVTVQAPVSPARGTVTVEVVAADSDSGVAIVELQRRIAGGTWASVGTSEQARHTFTLDTATLVDGTHELRAIAIDHAGYTTISGARTLVVVNDAAVTLPHPGAIVRGTVTLSPSLAAPGPADWSVQIETAAGAGWQPLSPRLTAPYAWEWDTTNLPDGLRDLRAVATTGSLRTDSAVVTDVLVDNTAPTVSVVLPAGPLKGTVTVGATASDATSGVQSVMLQSATSSTGPWTDRGSVNGPDAAFRLDTTTLPYGDHYFRAVATDRAGNRTTSAVAGPRLVDNTVRSITLASPGTWLEGTVTLSATATSTAQIASVRFQRADAGNNNWVDIGTDTAAPWSLAWDTRTVADRSYDLRAVLTDVHGNQAVSAVLPARVVDNVTTPFRGVDVQTTNVGTVGLMETGDRMIFTFSRRVDLASITPGWDGTSLPVRLQITDAGFWYGVTDDDLTVTRPGSTVNLGSIRITANILAKRDVDASFDATLTATTETVNGRPRTVVTVQVGSLLTGAVRATDLSSTMTWTPSTLVRSLGGQSLSADSITESGSNDKDF